MDNTNTLEVHLLGSFLLHGGGRSVAGLAQARIQHLLAYLLLYGQTPIARRQLAFTLWPDSDEQQALSNLRTALHRLQHALSGCEPYLVLERHTVAWVSGSDIRLDVATFEQALEQAARACEPAARAAALQTAVNAYTGDLLPNCYDEWIIQPRERLHQAFVRALEQLIEVREQQRQFNAAIKNAQRLLRVDPLHEAGYRGLMRLHMANDDQARALSAYHRCAALLRQELGVDPSPATQAIYQRLLQAGPAGAVVSAVPTAPVTAPTMPPLVGRQQEWARLLEIWQAASAGHGCLALLSGEPGVGATRLAEELAAWVWREGGDVAVARCHAASHGLPYAVVADWLRSPAIQPRLAALNPQRRAEIARLVPEVLGQQTAPRDPGPLTESWQRQRFFEALAAPLLAPGRPLLLWGDDLHRCDRETLDWLCYLLSRPGATRLLVLGAAHAQEVQAGHPLTALRLDLQRRGQWHELTLGPLGFDETVALAASLAGRSLTPCEARHLYDDSEGNPLFLVETVRGDLLAPVEAQPDADPDPHGKHCALCPRRISPPPSVQAVLAQRLAQLTPTARSLAQAAAVIGREFSLEVVQRASGLAPWALVEAVDELWRLGILRQEDGDNYAFSHDKLRAATYTELSLCRRQLLHRRTAEALQATKSGWPGCAALAAQHMEQAGERAQAIVLWQQAGDEAQAAGATDQAGRCYRRAASLRPD